MFNLVVITPETNHLKEIEIITFLFESGLELLHIRKPSYTEEELREYILSIPRKFHKKIVIHSYYKLTKEFSFKGIHLTEKARKSKRINADLKIISTSFHSVEEILKSRRKYKYIFLSPIFDSISKKGYKSNFNLLDLEFFLKKRKNVVALGGINTDNIKAVKQIGFCGAAILGALWESENPIKAYKNLALKIK